MQYATCTPQLCKRCKGHEIFNQQWLLSYMSARTCQYQGLASWWVHPWMATPGHCCGMHAVVVKSSPYWSCAAKRSQVQIQAAAILCRVCLFCFVLVLCFFVFNLSSTDQKHAFTLLIAGIWVWTGPHKGLTSTPSKKIGIGMNSIRARFSICSLWTNYWRKKIRSKPQLW